MLLWHVQSSKRIDVDSVSKKHRGQINYSQPLFSGFVHYDLQLHCDTPVKNKMCGLSASFSQFKSRFQWACMVVMLEDLFIEGGWYIQEKQKKGGWGLTGVSVGIWGWATVEQPPRYCLLCQAESVFSQEAGANLSTSTNAPCLPSFCTLHPIL